jgi:hypothetical protein
MQPIHPPPMPGNLSAYTDKQQADAAFILYEGALEVVGKCLSTRDTLIHWINGDDSHASSP